MLRIKNKLTVLHDDNGTFTDYSNEALDFDRDDFTIAMDSATGRVLVGFTKPINVFFVEFTTANTNAGSLTGKYYNGTAFTELSGYIDETDSFTRSAFVRWDRNQTDEEKTTIDSKERFWYEFTTDATHSATVFAGLNIVFADDQDLKRECFEVSEFKPTGEDSHILTHVAARDHIIQFLRNSGHFKASNETGRLKDITAFDILDVGQVKLAATYLALSKIYLNLSDEDEDQFIQKHRLYNKLYDSAIRTFYLDLDADDDGIHDTEERLASNTTRLKRR